VAGELVLGRNTVALVAFSTLAALAGRGDYRLSADPEKLFAEAEALRLRFEKAASHQAIARYEQAQAVWERRGDKPAAARAAQGVALTYEQLGAIPESRDEYLSALSLVEQSPDRGLESEILSEVGRARALAADRHELLEQARRQCGLALQTARRVGSGRGEAKALTCLAEVHYHSGSLDDALQLYRESEVVWSRMDDRRGKAEALLYQGYVHSDVSRFEQAHDCYERAMALWIALGDKRGQAVTLVADARLRERRGENQEALNRFHQALEILRPSGDAAWEAASLTGVGTIYLNLARTELALRYWERALDTLETAGLRGYMADALISLGETYLVSGDDSRALSRFERALALADELGNPRYQSYALRYLGLVHLIRHAPAQAQAYLARSLHMQRALGNPRFEALTRADMGDAYEILGEPRVATGYFERAITLGILARDRVAQARGLFGLARTALDLKDLDSARAYVESALQVAEGLRTEVERRDLRASYFASVYRYHEFHMDVLMRLHRSRPGAGLAAEALAACERARARSLLEGLTDAEVDLRAALDPDLLRREQLLKAALEDWAQRWRRLGLGSPRDPVAAGMAAEYRELEDRYDQLESEIRSGNPRYAALTRPQPLGLGALQREVLDANTVLLEYALGDERSYLWSVSQAGLGSYVLPPREEIERAARGMYGRLTARLTLTGPDRARALEQADADYRREAKHLSEMLLAPVAKQLAGKRILVVADGALQYVPFAALPVPGGGREPVPMMVEHEIVSLPSASVLAILRRETRDRRPRPGAVAVLADPVFEADDPRLRAVKRSLGRSPSQLAGAASLPDGPGAGGFPRLGATRLEADAIVAVAPPGTALRAVDFAASRATAMSPELAGYEIVHFATHAVLDNENPGLSAVVLSMFDERGEPADGYLRLRDIYGLRLPAELVVLSACNTALGKPVRGEGLVGIVRGFMYAGARRVVASLWKVDDEATGELMARFYREVLRSHRSPAAALRQAQLAMWQQERWRPPFYWAAFVLQGEWK
jgi:CHAT domain-containing protein/predicted negative regulator of RcsB-dependent stress response